MMNQNKKELHLLRVLGYLIDPLLMSALSHHS